MPAAGPAPELARPAPLHSSDSPEPAGLCGPARPRRRCSSSGTPTLLPLFPAAWAIRPQAPAAAYSVRTVSAIGPTSAAHKFGCAIHHRPAAETTNIELLFEAAYWQAAEPRSSRPEARRLPRNRGACLLLYRFGVGKNS